MGPGRLRPDGWIGSDRTAGWRAAWSSGPVATALGLALLGVTALRLPAAWTSGNALNHVSGAYMALADDLAHGTLYRALLDPALGFGGTRDFPLAFALHAALLKLGVPLLPAGFLLSAAAGALLVGALTVLLRRAGLGPAAALGAAALALAGFAAQHGLAAVRADLLAVALEAAGLACLLRTPPRQRPALGAAAGWLALAALAKPTALTALAAGAAFLWLRRERREALRLVLGVGALALAGVGLTQLASGGRFLGVLAACASGGAGLRGLLAAPLRLASLFAREDRAGLVLVTAGVVAVLASLDALRPARAAPLVSRRCARLPPAVSLAAAWLGAAVLGALIVLASPGTGVNHLVELEAAAAAAIGAAGAGFAGAGLAWPRRAALRLAAPVAALMGLLMAGHTWRADATSARLDQVRATVAAVEATRTGATGGARGPILSEDPLVPLLAGERPVAVDLWMLRLSAERDPAVRDALGAALTAGSFRAVVVLHGVDAPGAEAWFAGDLGLPALHALRRGYHLAGQAGLYYVYAPVAPAMNAVFRTGPPPKP